MEREVSRVGSIYFPPIQMELSEIQATLARAWRDNYQVWLAMNVQEENGVYKEGRFYIENYLGEYALINKELIQLKVIRAVEF